MAGENRAAPHPVADGSAAQRAQTLFAALAERPFDFDFLQTLRRLECLFPDRPRLGAGARPVDEPLRLGQEPSLAFAPRTLAAFRPANARRPRPRLDVFFFGLFGPNGPLPLHLTEFVRERQRNVGDQTLARFADLFHHRLLALFYRAWASAEPAVQFDRPESDQFGRQLAALTGLGTPALRNRSRDAGLSDLAKLHYAGLFAMQTGSAAGLATLLSDYLGLPVRVDQFIGQWLTLDSAGLTRLGDTPATGSLGETAVIGARVWDRQHKFRVIVGPLDYPDYRRLLPGGVSLSRLVALVRGYSNNALDWDLNLVLKKDQVPALQLGRAGELGWTTWLAGPEPAEDPDPLHLNATFYANRLSPNPALG